MNSLISFQMRLKKLFICSIVQNFVHAFPSVACAVSGACRRCRVAGVNASCLTGSMVLGCIWDSGDFTCWVNNWICSIWVILNKEVSSCLALNMWKCSHTTDLCSAFNRRVCPCQHKQQCDHMNKQLTDPHGEGRNRVSVDELRAPRSSAAWDLLAAALGVFPTTKLSKRGDDSSDHTEGGNLFHWAHTGPINACGSWKCQSNFITNEVNYL